MPRKPTIATVEDLAREIQAYCARYGTPGEHQDSRPGSGAAPESSTSTASSDALPALPAFPAGLRESPQHREWLALYKARARLARGPQG